MKALTLTAVRNQLSNIVKATDESNLQNLFINAVYHGLVHGNIMPNQLKLIRESNAASKFKAGIAKHMPAKWNKEKAQYSYDKAKANKLLEALGLERETSTIEQVAAALPNLFEKVERKQSEYDRAKYLALVAQKLAKEGEQEVELIMGIVATLLDNPERVAKTARAALAGEQQTKAA